MWAEIGAWPWALDWVRDRALGKRLPPSWTWESDQDLQPIACPPAFRNVDIEPGPRWSLMKAACRSAREEPRRFNDMWGAGLITPRRSARRHRGAPSSLPRAGASDLLDDEHHHDGDPGSEHLDAAATKAISGKNNPNGRRS